MQCNLAINYKIGLHGCNAMDEKNLECLFYEQVHVKEEIEHVKEEIEHVKEEAEWEDTAFLHGISEAAAQAGLYAGHEVKDELVLGPEGLQPADVVFTLRAIDALYREQPALRECAVRLERLDLKTLFSSCRGAEQDSKPGYALIGESKPTFVLRDCVVKLERLVRQKPPRATGSSRAEHKNETHYDTDNEIYICDTCKKWFSVKTELIEHVMIHIRKSAWSARIQRDIVNGESAIVLRDCVVKLERLVRQEPPRVGSSRAEHKKEIHNDTDIEIYICDTCKKWFSVKTELIEHVMIHVRKSAWSVRSERDIANGESAIVLRDCVVKLERLVRQEPPRVGSSRAEHKTETHNDTDNEIYICDTCKKWFSVKTELIEHVMIHVRRSASSVRIERDVANGMHREAHNRDKELDQFVKVTIGIEGMKSYACALCIRQYPNRRRFTDHFRSFHQKRRKKTHPCVLCKEELVPRFRWRHMEENHGWPAPTCDECGRKFSYRFQVENHKKEVHMGVKNVVCDKCGKFFPNENRLKAHAAIHVTENKFKCDLCPKTFKTKAYLTFHCKTHTNQKQHVCDQCGRAFLNVKNLRQHSVKHMVERKYKCEVCSKSFKTPRYLRIHMMIHLDDNDKKYVCRICDAKYVQSYNLKLHMRKKHPGVEAKPEADILGPP